MREIYRKKYSKELNREMEYLVFCADDPDDRKHTKVSMAFPPQDGRYWDFKDFGMVEAARPWIDSGQMYLICVDGIDRESWSGTGDPRYRIEMQERWYHYVVDELLPEYTENAGKVLGMGCSMGATHAGNFFFRRPDIFDGIIAMSGIYNAQFFWGDYFDDLVYANSPIHFLPNMPYDHPWMELYKKSHIVLCCGQGAWEDDLLYSTRILSGILAEKGIPHWADYWGFDVNHDWPWWRKQLPYFLDRLTQKGLI